MGPPTGFRNGYWASPPAGGLALPERFRRRRNRSAFGDSAEGGIALLLPPCGRLTYKSRCAQCKYELTGMNKLGYANAGGRSAGMREAHSGFLSPQGLCSLIILTFPEPLFSLLFLCSLLFSPFYQTLSDTAQRATVNKLDHLFNFLVLYNSLIIFDVRQQAASSNQQHGPPGCAKR